MCNAVTNNFYLISSLFLLSLLIATPGTNAQTNPDGSWLDGNTNWNQAGLSIPKAPSYEEGNNLSNCEDTLRPAALPEDELVEAAGWALTSAAQIYGSTTVVTGMGDADGMCRPLDFQTFVFTDGKFVGTLSPILMDSRTDGSLIDIDLFQAGLIRARFNRYAPEDALCCASEESQLFFQLETQDDTSTLIPQLPADTYTTNNE